MSAQFAFIFSPNKLLTLVYFEVGQVWFYKSFRSLLSFVFALSCRSVRAQTNGLCIFKTNHPHLVVFWRLSHLFVHYSLE